MSRLLIVALGLVASGFVAAPQDPVDGAAEPLTSRPLVSFEGARSEIPKRSYHRVSDANEWARLWIRHTGGEAPERDYDWYWNTANVPEIDFEKCLVVAVFDGDGWNSNGFDVESILETDELVRVRIDGKSYQTSGPDGGGVRVRPFGIWVLPRTDKVIALEENTQGLIGKPPVWTERARF